MCVCACACVCVYVLCVCMCVLCHPWVCVHEHICGFIGVHVYVHGHLCVLLYVMIFCNLGNKRRAEDDRQDGAKRVSAGE